MSCSSFGRRGGEGPGENGLGLPSDDAKVGVVERGRSCDEGRDMRPRWKVFKRLKRGEYAMVVAVFFDQVCSI